jgi:hypothetical protein
VRKNIGRKGEKRKERENRGPGERRIQRTPRATEKSVKNMYRKIKNRSQEPL